MENLQRIPILWIIWDSNRSFKMLNLICKEEAVRWKVKGNFGILFVRYPTEFIFLANSGKIFPYFAAYVNSRWLDIIIYLCIVVVIYSSAVLVFLFLGVFSSAPPSNAPNRWYIYIYFFYNAAFLLLFIYTCRVLKGRSRIVEENV